MVELEVQGWSKIIDKIINLIKLKKISKLNYENWNGYHAIPISSIVVKRTRDIILKAVVQPEIFPLSSSGIQLEYDKPDNSYLQFRIMPDNFNVFVLDSKGNSTEVEEPHDITIEEINNIIMGFYKI